MTEAKEKAIRAQAKCLGIDSRILLRLPTDEMSAASYFPLDPAASLMEPWPQPQPEKIQPDNRTLRIRNCDPPRLTTKKE